jgi:hypothetical protein
MHLMMFANDVERVALLCGDTCNYLYHLDCITIPVDELLC